MIDKPGRPLPIMRGTPIAGAVASFINCPPVTHLYLAADPDWTPESARSPKHNGRIYLALIDTGSDAVAIRPEVALAIGAKLTGNGVSHGIGGSHSGVERASVQVIFPAANVIFHSDAAVVPLAGDARSFDLILGRTFLKHCRLYIDGPNAAYRLEWIG